MQPTTVVNVRSGEEAFDVYIGRGSKWGNPFRIGEYGTRDEVIEKYEEWLANNPALLRALPEIKGKVLGCYCKPLACHGDVLARFADKET